MERVVEAAPRLEAMMVQYGVDATGTLAFPPKIL
jgi:hypothetical protein